MAGTDTQAPSCDGAYHSTNCSFIVAMDACTDDNIFAIASYLQPTDLVRLALVCKRFGGGANNKSTKSKRRQDGEWPWSLMEEASRRRVSAAKDDKNNKWRNSDLLTVNGDEESWMTVDQRLHLLQSSLVFSRIIGSSLNYINGDISHIQGKRKEAVGYSIAICQEVMKSGRHYAEFVVTKKGAIYIGIVRPIHDYPKKKIKFEDFRSYCSDKREDPGYVGNRDEWYYYDERVSLENGDIIGLLLDLDKGTTTVYKNGTCLQRWHGASRLYGHYSWAVKMNNYGSTRPSVRIQPGISPVKTRPR